MCMLTDPVVQDELDRRVGQMTTMKNGKPKYEYTPVMLNEWLATKLDLHVPISDPTIYAHRKHVLHPKDRVVSIAAKRAKEGRHLPQVTTEQGFLDSIIAMGHQKAMDDPEAVTIDHALKATQIKNQSKDKGNAQNVLVQIFTQGAPEDDIIDVTAQEVT